MCVREKLNKETNIVIVMFLFPMQGTPQSCLALQSQHDEATGKHEVSFLVPEPAWTLHTSVELDCFILRITNTVLFKLLCGFPASVVGGAEGNKGGGQVSRKGGG